MSYFFVILSVFCIAAQFSLTKLYQLRAGTAVLVTVAFTMVAGVVSCLVFLIAAGFRIEISGFSALMSLATAAVCTANGILGILSVSCGKVSVYTMFMMLGGMLVPFFFGVIFLNEPISAFRIVGCVLLFLSLLAPLSDSFRNREPVKKAFYPLCAAVFVLNGFMGVIAKTHQTNPAASGTFDYLVFVYLFSFAMSAIVFLAVFLRRRAKRKSEKTVPEYQGGAAPELLKQVSSEASAAKISVSKSKWIILGLIAGYAIVSGVGYMLQLFGAENLPASVMYPIVTGGSVVLTTIAGRLFFKEKLSPVSLAGVAVTLAATILFLF